MGSRFALALARDGQRLRLDVFKGLVVAAAVFARSRIGRSPLAGRSARSRPHDDDDGDEEREIIAVADG